MSKATTGIRRKFYEYLDERYMRYPRGTRKHDSREWLKLSHPEKWYYDGHLTDRPLYGILGLGKVSELWLHRVTYPKQQWMADFYSEFIEFYAEVRRVMKNILSTYQIDERIPRDKVRSLRTMYLELCEKAEYLMEQFEPVRCTCPLCGKKNAVVIELDLLRAIMSKALERGDIPPGTNLFEFARLTSAPVL